MIIDHSPLNTEKAAEGLRMAVGQTMADNHVVVLLLDAGAWAALPLKPVVVKGGELKKPIETIIMLKHEVWVEEESLAQFGISPDRVVPGIKVVTRRQVEQELADAGAVIRF